MPLRDHFHAPWSEHHPWEGFHSAWINTMVRHLNGTLLPRRYRAIPQVHLGPFVEADVATFDQAPSHQEGAAALTEGDSQLWSPPAAVQTPEIELPAQDVFEARIVDDSRGMRLVAAIELVSPGNKDRPEHRQAFVTKCAAYLQEQVNVVVVDIVTSRLFNLHDELLDLLATHPADGAAVPFCVAYRIRKEGSRWQLDYLSNALSFGNPLPVVPLCLSSNLSIPLDLEKSYEETCQVLRISE